MRAFLLGGDLLAVLIFYMEGRGWLCVVFVAYAGCCIWRGFSSFTAR
jgi:hypothetical protein